MVKSCWRWEGEGVGESRLLVDILAGLFGISAWLSVNALFTQLPLLVQTAPEGWTLPSYLSILIQVANIGPILYSVLQKCGPRLIKDSCLITVVILTGTASVLLLSLFYKDTGSVLGQPHSIPLFLLTFCIALVGCTSSVLFIPFMNNYPEVHLVSYLVGEGLSGFIPSIVSLIQGVGMSKCVNKTDSQGDVILVHENSPPLFTSQVFFLIIFALMSASTVAFLLLNNLPVCKSVKICKQTATRSSTLETTTADEKELRLETGVVPPPPPMSTGSSLSPATYKGLLLLQAVISLFANGALPSIQSYSCLPYGSTAYHLAVNLANMANPAACFVAFFLPRTSLTLITVMSVMSALLTSYSLTTALLSPFPPLQHSSLGVALIVLCWVVSCGLISYVKLSIAALFRREGGRGLFWYGAMTQAGSAIGSVVMFYLVNYTNTFQMYDPCR